MWIRHTVHKRPAEEPTAALWLTVFDADAPGPRATKASFAAGELAAPEGAYIRVDGAVLEPGRATGELETPELEASWDLSFDDPGEAFHHLPYERLYEAPLPRTKFLSPYPSARFERHGDGGRRADRARRLAGDDRPQLGRGARRALGVDPGRRPGRRAGELPGPRRGSDQGRPADHAVGGQRDAAHRRLRAPARRLRPHPVDEAGRAADLLRVPALGQGPEASRPGVVGAPQLRRLDLRRSQGARAQHAQLLDRRPRAGGRAPRRQPERLELSGGATYEIGMRQTDHGIPVQPYPDG